MKQWFFLVASLCGLAFSAGSAAQNSSLSQTSVISRRSPNTEVREAIQKIMVAARIRDTHEGKVVFRESVREALLSTDPAIREEAVYLFVRNPQYDVSELADISDECQELYGEPCLSYMLDMTSLKDANREVRVNLFTQAILDGEAALWRGTRLSRWHAMTLAAAEGMTEVVELVNRYYPDLDDRVQQGRPLDELLLEFEIRSGGKDSRDALALATERITGIDDQDFARKMEVEPSFKNVVFRIAGDSCRESTDDPTCQIWIDIWEFHSTRGRRLIAERAAEVKPAKEDCGRRLCPDSPWWEWMKYSLMTDEQREMLRSQY